MIQPALRRLSTLLNRASGIFDSPDPLVVVPYRGYANNTRIFLKGRVLENEGIFEGKSENELRNLFDSLKRFDSDEVENAKVSIRLDENYFELVTDEEGFFTLDEAWQSPPKSAENRWLKADVQLLEAPGYPVDAPAVVEVPVLLPSKNASYGIISDVDDTVLQTHVTSRFKLKMFYATLFRDAHQRLPMEGIPDLLRAFEKGSDGQRENPLFYVSASPWNLYDLLTEFMDLQQLPRGPVLLQDMGLPPFSRAKDYRGYKLETISHILRTYPEMEFIMLGDTASKDADYYLTLAEEFSGRISAIYIRQTRDTANARRVTQLINSNADVNAVMVKSSAEIWEHARKQGYLAS